MSHCIWPTTFVNAVYCVGVLMYGTVRLLNFTTVQEQDHTLSAWSGREFIVSGFRNVFCIHVAPYSHDSLRREMRWSFGVESANYGQSKRFIQTFLSWTEYPLKLKGISRGPEALQSHLNDFYRTSVLCWPWQTINPWTCRVMVPFILE